MSAHASLPSPPARGTDDRSLLTLADVSRDDLVSLIDASLAFRGGARSEVGRGQLVGTYFALTSTRTRTSFAAAALRLGANVIAYGPADLQLATGESSDDTGRVLAGMLDVLIARTGGPLDDLRQLSAAGGLPVINAMSDREHPTQAVGDLATISARLDGLHGVSLLYLGEGNSTAAALALAVAIHGGMQLELRTPAGYGLPQDLSDLVADLAQQSGAQVRERHDMADLPAADVVYTTQWRTTGTVKPDPDWLDRFRPFAVTPALLERVPGALVMHDLPARRGEEIAHGVLESPASIAFDQAHMKLHGATAVLQRAFRGAP